MRILGAAAMALVLSLPAAGLAQERATLVLKSGQRVSGELVDMGGSGFTVSVNGAQQTIRPDEVAVIDFVGGGEGLPSTETSKVPSSGGLVVLRGGQSFQGSLSDIGGTQPLRMTFDTPQGRRDLTSSEVGRVYLSRLQGWATDTANSSSTSPGTTGTSGTTSVPTTGGSGAGIAVRGNATWVPTGITVAQGQPVSFQSSGSVQLSTDGNDVATPAGSKTGKAAAPRAPLPGVLAGALVGRVGNSAPFAIGDQTGPLPMPAAGQLFLAVNDDVVGDNSGQFTVQVVPGARTRRH